jgi:hypothetical protein
MAIEFSAHIYELTGWKARRKDELALFSGKFFRGPINASTQVCVLGELNGVIATLYIFFSQDAVAYRVMVVVSRESSEPLIEPDARGVLGQFVGPTQKELVSRVIWARGSLEQAKQSISSFLRDSGSLVEADFTQHGRLCVASDARGIAVVDTTTNALPPGERVERLAVLSALAFAYQSVLDDAIDHLALVGRDSPTAAERQLREWSYFMSSYYFHEPIKLSTIELARFYGAVRDRHKISGLAQEVTDQLKLLAELVRLDRSEAQAWREKLIQNGIAKTSLRLTFVGAALAFVGAILTFTQVTPKVIGDAVAQWTECEKTIGLVVCVKGGYKETLAPSLILPSIKPNSMLKKLPPQSKQN